jgi:hypothetical protein
MTQITSNLFFTILSVLFFIGFVHVLLLFKKRSNSQNFFKLILLVIFITPFVLYLIVGSLGLRLGNPRNFFYLLPIYFLIIFNVLKKLIYNRKIFYSISLIILVVLLFNGMISSYGFWKKVYIERALMRQAAKIDADLALVTYTQRTKWPFQYYARRFGLSQTSYPWDSNKDKELAFRFLENIKNIDNFAIIGGQQAHLEEEYFLGKRLFKLNKIIHYKANYGPFGILQEFFDRSSSVTISLFNET